MSTILGSMRMLLRVSIKSRNLRVVAEVVLQIKCVRPFSRRYTILPMIGMSLFTYFESYWVARLADPSDYLVGRRRGLLGQLGAIGKSYQQATENNFLLAAISHFSPLSIQSEGNYVSHPTLRL